MHQNSNSPFETRWGPFSSKADSSGSSGTSGEPVLDGHRESENWSGEIVERGSLEQQIHQVEGREHPKVWCRPPPVQVQGAWLCNLSLWVWANLGKKLQVRFKSLALNERGTRRPVIMVCSADRDHPQTPKRQKIEGSYNQKLETRFSVYPQHNELYREWNEHAIKILNSRNPWPLQPV